MRRYLWLPLLLVASAAQADCITLNGSVSGSANVCSQAAAGSGTQFNLPNTTGSNHDVLKTDGSGNTAWTGSPTLTGTNFSGIAAGTALTGQVPVANGGTAGATGAVAAVNLSVPYLVCNPTLTTDTGTTSETKIATCTIPANTLGTAGALRVIYIGSATASANTKTHTIRWGPNNSTADTACGTTANPNNGTNNAVQMHAYIFATGATNTNNCVQPGSNRTTLNSVSDTSMAVNTTATTYVNITCTLANSSENCTPLHMSVVFFPVGGN